MNSCRWSILEGDASKMNPANDSNSCRKGEDGQTKPPFTGRHGNGGSSCSSGTWYCCSKSMGNFQEFVERFYWSNPLPPPPGRRQVPSSSSAKNPNSIPTTFQASRVGDLEIGQQDDASKDQAVAMTGDVGSYKANEHENYDLLKDFHGDVRAKESFPPTMMGRNLIDPTYEARDPLLACTDIKSEMADDDEFDYRLGSNTDWQQGTGSSFIDMAEALDELDEMELGSPTPLLADLMSSTPSATASEQPPPQSTEMPVNLADIKDEPVSDDDGIEEDKSTQELMQQPEDEPALLVPNPLAVVGRRSERRVMQYQCSTPSCKKRFSHYETLVTHEKQHNLGDTKPFFCSKCKRSYATKAMYDNHLERHRKCKKCGQQLKNAPTAKAARNPISPTDAFCISCIKKYFPSDDDSLKTTLVGREQAKDDFSTEEEDDEEGEEDDNDRGYEERTDDNKLTCGECGKQFVFRKRYDRHLQRHRQPKWQCKTCQEVFEVQHKLRLHVRTHQEEWNFACSQCDQRFQMAHHLRHHMTVHTVSSEHACIVCKKEFGSLCSLRTHQKKASLCRSKLDQMKLKKIDKKSFTKRTK